MSTDVHLDSAAGHAQPSDWLRRWAHLAAPGCTALDVACGSGRHLRWLHEQGHRVHAVDRDAQALSELGAWLRSRGSPAHENLVCADIERGPWPYAGQTFGLVLVSHYLWRPLLTALVDCVAPGGVLIYETFTLPQRTIGRPSNPDFLLAPGELLELARQADLEVIAYESGFERPAQPLHASSLAQAHSLEESRCGRHIQRIAARRANLREAG